MTRVEYLTVHKKFIIGFDETDARTKSWANDLNDYLEFMGGEQWELIQTFGYKKFGGFYIKCLIFKRIVYYNTI